MEEKGTLHKSAIQAVVEGIKRGQSMNRDYPIKLPCTECGGKEVRWNAAVQDAVVRTNEDWAYPGRPIDVTVSIPGIMALNLMIETSDRDDPMDEAFLDDELGLETFIKEIHDPDELEELGREFRADRGLNTGDRCADCEEERRD